MVKKVTYISINSFGCLRIKLILKRGLLSRFSRVFRDLIVSVSRRCISVIVCFRGICNFLGNILF